MKDFRFKLNALTSAPYVLLSALPKSNRLIAMGDKASIHDRFLQAKRIVRYMRKHYRTTTYVYGTKNIPKENGFIVYANHQGKYDALCIFEAMNKDTSVLWERRQASRILSRQICGLIDAVPIDLKNPRDIVAAIGRCTDIVSSGRNMIIFPEGGYEENHNDMQNFNTGCFSINIKTKCTILPVVLFDAYKAMNTNYLGKVKTAIYFLPPIPYSEYEGLKKSEIAELVKSRIEEKLSELKSCENPYAASMIKEADFVMDRKFKN